MKLTKIKFIIIAIIMIIITIVTFFIKPNEYYDNDDDYSYSTKSTSSANISRDIKISDVRLTSESYSSYVKCIGTVTVRSTSDYKYHYVKVRASFKNRSGTTIDTDWTYAIDSDYLSPGESKKVELSVKKDSDISTCTISVIES